VFHHEMHRRIVAERGFLIVARHGRCLLFWWVDPSGGGQCGRLWGRGPCAVVDGGRSDQADTAVAMFVMVPVEEVPAVSTGVLDRAETIGEVRSLRLGVWIVIRDMRAAVRLGNIEVDEERGCAPGAVLLSYQKSGLGTAAIAAPYDQAVASVRAAAMFAGAIYTAPTNGLVRAPISCRAPHAPDSPQFSMTRPITKPPPRCAPASSPRPSAPKPPSARSPAQACVLASEERSRKLCRVVLLRV
jgi:hypothetical protein